MTTSIHSVDDLLQSILPEGASIYGSIETMSGVHVPVFAAMLIDMLETDQGTYSNDMVIYTAIKDVLRSDLLECEMADQIADITARIAINKQKRSILMRVLQKQAGTRKQLLEAGKAVEMPELSNQKIDEDNNYDFSDLDKAFGLTEAEQELVDKTIADGTLAGLQRALMDVDSYGEDGDIGVASNGEGGTQNKFTAPGEPVPFQNDEEGLREALHNLFESVGKLEGAPIDALYLSDRLDGAIHRSIQYAYGFTGNTTEKFTGYIRVLNEFANSDNKMKQELYQRLSEICDYVINHDLGVFGLNPTYEQLRLSQIIPNYFLKKVGYIMDASSCSSGKTGTILLAPVETDSKVSVVLVENNTYETILGEFNTWYSTRQDYLIVPKEDFWPTPSFDWTKSDKKIILVLDKAFVSRIDDKKREAMGAETFASLIKRSGIELLVADEVHNYKGRDVGGEFKVVKANSGETDEAHSNCSRCTHIMAIHSTYRLFSSATPLLNDLQEPARLLSMLFPPTYETKDKNHRHQRAIGEIKDSPSATENILEKTAVLFTPLHANTTRVPKPDVEYDIEVVSNEGQSIINGRLRRNRNTWMDSWTNTLRQLVNEQYEEWNLEDKQPWWSDQKQDELHFDLYLTLMEKQIVSALEAGKQICFYTNDSMQTHEQLKARILDIADKNKVQLGADEVVIANGTTSTNLRKSVTIKELGTKRPRLIQKVWDKSCKVLIANEVIEVGLDGLQGTDNIDGCGRISEVFLLANPYTDAAKYQLFSRFVRTQGSDSNKLPEVKFWQPMLFWDSSLENEPKNQYARNDHTNQRIYLKKLRSDLLLDGVFPDGINIAELKREIPQMIYRQYEDGTFATDEGRDELEDRTMEILQSGEAA